MSATIKGFTKGIWDKISPKEDLSRRFYILSRFWYEFLKTAVSDLGFAHEDDENRPTQEYILLLNHKLNLNPGVKNSANRAKSIFSNYFNTCRYHKAQNGNDIDKESLVKYGFDEEAYKKALYNMSVYMAAVTGLEIPQKIKNYCSQKSINDDPEISIDENDIFTNPCDRFPVVFIIDTSSSMSNSLPTLQKGLRYLIGLLHDDERLRQQVELYVMTTTGQKLIGFSTIKEPEKITGNINLNPCMSPARIVDALNASIKDLRKKIELIKNVGVDLYCPWIIIISNGHWIPKYNEKFDEIAETVKNNIEEKVFKLYVRTLKEPHDMSESQRELVSKLDPNFEALKETNNFFKTAFQSICRMKVTSPSCGDEMELSKTTFLHPDKNF